MSIQYRRDIYELWNRASSQIVRVVAAFELAQEFRKVLPAKVKIINSMSSVCLRLSIRYLAASEFSGFENWIFWLTFSRSVCRARRPKEVVERFVLYPIAYYLLSDSLGHSIPNIIFEYQAKLLVLKHMEDPVFVQMRSFQITILQIKSLIAATKLRWSFTTLWATKSQELDDFQIFSMWSVFVKFCLFSFPGF